MFVVCLIRPRAVAAVLLAAALGIVLFLARPPVFGDHIIPLFIPGDPHCSALAPPGVTWYQFKIQPVEDGIYRYAGATVTLDVYSTLLGDQVDWSANTSVNAVFVKGGPGGNLYQYAPPGHQETTDDHLHAPLQLLGGEYYGMDHLLFCTSTPPPTPTPPIEPSPTPTASPTPGPTPTPTPTRLPSTYWYYLPLDPFTTMSGEPNNRCDEAQPILSHMTHSFLADDLHDWYEFELLNAGHLFVELMNFLSLDGQLVAYAGDDCDSADIICYNGTCNNGESAATKQLDLGPQEAGRYYLYVSNDGQPNSTDPYQLFVGFR